MNVYKRIILFFTVGVLSTITSIAQTPIVTNITQKTSAVHLYTSKKTVPFAINVQIENQTQNPIRTYLQYVQTDCFLITFDLPAQNYTADTTILQFQNENVGILLWGTPFMTIGIGNDQKWYIERLYTDQNGSLKNIKYRIYDDIGTNGKYTIIVSGYFIGIAHDEDNNWSFTPAFFGLNSNANHAGSYNYTDAFFNGIPGSNLNSSHQQPQIVGRDQLYNNNMDISIYMMPSNNKKMTNLIKILNSSQNNVNNERPVTTDSNPIVVKPQKLKSKKIILYPNPASDMVTIITPFETGQSINFQLLDSTGKVVYQETYLQHTINKVITLPNNLNSGVYFANIEANQSREKIKLIINH